MTDVKSRQSLDGKPTSGLVHRRNNQASVASMVLLSIAVMFHLSLLLSWRTGLWNRFTFDSTVTHGRKGWDFYALYQAGANALCGDSIYESDSARITVVVPVYTPYRYLPLPALSLGTLLNMLSPVSAFWVWVIVLEMLLLYCGWRSWRLANSGSEGAILLSLWLLYSPYYLELYMGQFTFVESVLILVLMLWPERRIQRFGFDLIWIASLLWKQLTVLFTPLWILWGRWRGFVAGISLAAITSLPYFLAEPTALRAYLAQFTRLPGTQLGNLGMLQFLVAVSQALYPKISTMTITAIQLSWALLVIVVSLWISWKGRKQLRGVQLALWTTVFLLVSPEVWEHHYVLLLPVFLLLYHETHSPLLLVLYGLLAIWTPYRLIDPGGLAAYHMPMRWTPLQPAWLGVVYHASKALPAAGVWLFICGYFMREPGVTFPIVANS